MVKFPSFRRNRGGGEPSSSSDATPLPPPQPAEPRMEEQPERAPPRSILRQPDRQEAHLEEIAMDTFRQRIHSSRTSNPYGYSLRAPGFDYMNWKPYGTVRHRNAVNEFPAQAQALAVYVRCVVISGCEGVEERRWKALTETAEHNAYLSSQQASRAVSTENLISSR